MLPQSARMAFLFHNDLQTFPNLKNGFLKRPFNEVSFNPQFFCFWFQFQIRFVCNKIAVFCLLFRVKFKKKKNWKFCKLRSNGGKICHRTILRSIRSDEKWKSSKVIQLIKFKKHFSLPLCEKYWILSEFFLDFSFFSFVLFLSTKKHSQKLNLFQININ